jgi:hypothetical protein
MITINSDPMKQQMSREQLEQRIAALEAQRIVLKRAAWRNFELAMRLSDLHVERAGRQLRDGK